MDGRLSGIRCGTADPGPSQGDEEEGRIGNVDRSQACLALP